MQITAFLLVPPPPAPSPETCSPPPYAAGHGCFPLSATWHAYNLELHYMSFLQGRTIRTEFYLFSSTTVPCWGLLCTLNTGNKNKENGNGAGLA